VAAEQAAAASGSAISSEFDLLETVAE